MKTLQSEMLLGLVSLPALAREEPQPSVPVTQLNCQPPSSAMSRYVPLNQPAAIMGAKNAILARTSDAYKGTTLFMPVVRSMSPAQRALLRAYLTGSPWQPPQ